MGFLTKLKNFLLGGPVEEPRKYILDSPMPVVLQPPGDIEEITGYVWEEPPRINDLEKDIRGRESQKKPAPKKKKKKKKPAVKKPQVPPTQV